MSDNNLDEAVWGAGNNAALLGLSRRQFYHKSPELIRAGVVQKMGRIFLGSRRRPLRFINGEITTRPSPSSAEDADDGRGPRHSAC
jgi:hypothetical protein